MENVVIGIEGYVGVGKTAIAKEMLKYIPNSIVFHVGNVYRAIIYGVLKSGTKMEELKHKLKNKNIKEVMDELKIKVTVEDKQTRVCIGNEKINDDELQNPQISMAVSTVCGVADNKHAYKVVREMIQEFKKIYNVILSCRDTMRIFPEVDYHLLLTASLDERVKRKSILYKDELSEEEVRKNIEQRDDLQQKAGYYDVFDKTKVIDLTECKTVEESTEKVLSYIDYEKFANSLLYV